MHKKLVIVEVALISSLYHAAFPTLIFIPLARAERDDSLPFSGASSVPLCYALFPATLLHQLFFHPLSPHPAIILLFLINYVFI